MQEEVAVVLRLQQGLEDTVNLGVDRMAYEGSLAGSGALARWGSRLGSPRSAAGRHTGQAEGSRRVIERKRRECREIQFAAQRGGRKIGCQDKGAAGWAMLDAITQSQGEMPEPRRLDLPLLPTGQGERYYLERFMAAFGEEWNGTAIVEAPTGHRLSVSPLMFTDHKTGKTKIDKEGRAPYVLYISETILHPDEVRLETGGYGDQVLYLLSRYWIGANLTNIIAVFKDRGQVWEGWSGYQIPGSRDAYWQTKRQGIQLYPFAEM
jgi:hypothetical protein